MRRTNYRSNKLDFFARTVIDYLNTTEESVNHLSNRIQIPSSTLYAFKFRPEKRFVTSELVWKLWDELFENRPIKKSPE